MMDRIAKGFILILLCLISTQFGFACFCDRVSIADENFTSYDEVFLGKIVEIKRFDVTWDYENAESYTFVGTETIFQVKRKWKGDSNNRVSVFQANNSCSVDFMIEGYDWIISARNKPFTSSFFLEKMDGKYLQTEWCAMNISQREKTEFKKVEQKLDWLFPVEIRLRKDRPFLEWTFVLLVLMVGVIIGLTSPV